jgi:hypothetical protein
MKIIEDIKRSRNDYFKEHNKYPNYLFIGRDIQYLLNNYIEETTGKERKTPWRLIKLFGMNIIPVDTDMHFSIGFCHNIMYDI